MMDTLTLRHQASGIRHQASGIRHQASGKESNHSLKGAFLFLIIVFSMMAMVNPARAEGNVLITRWTNPYETTIYSSGQAACDGYAKKMAVDFRITYGSQPYAFGRGGYWCEATSYPYWSNPLSFGCPANSSFGSIVGPPLGAMCTCGTGYQPDAAGTSCVAPNNCPANMSGTPCACNSGYVPNLGGLGCVLEQYTLMLISNPIQMVEPSNAAFIIAMVEDAQGNGKSGVRVSIRVDVDATSGGHDHGGTNRDKGATSGEACNPPESNCAIVTTDPGGYAYFTFNAPAVSGVHTYTAACVSPACSGTAAGTINVKVDGLIQIPDSPLYVLIKKPGAIHGNGHFLTPEASTVLRNMAASYQYEFMFLQRKQFRFGRWGQFIYTPLKLHVNDASLVWGGRFDYRGNWNAPHSGHKRGVVIDVRANDKTTGTIPLSSFDDFIKMAASKKNSVNSKGAEAQVHCTVSPSRKPPTCVSTVDGSQDTNRHFHILLLGVDR